LRNQEIATRPTLKERKNEMTFPHPEPDVLDEAMVVEPRKFFGQVSTEARRVVLIKGKGKEDYDPAVHGDKARTSIAVKILVIPCDPTAKLIERDVLNWTGEFTAGIRPSLDKVTPQIKAVKGLTAKEINPLREISGLWVSGDFIPRPGNKAGETWTTLGFTTVYKDEAACQAAYAKHIAENGGGNAQAAPAGVDDMLAAEQPKRDNGNDAQRGVLAQFLPNLWAQSNKDKAAFATLLAANPMIGNVFTMDAPEVVALVEGTPF